MDDEEEIDIINFDDISKITSGQLLSCDYTVHPKWVNENAEGGNFWSDSVPKHENLENNVEVLHSEEVVIKEPEPASNILDLEWTGEEDVVFEEDIPASVEEIVTNDGEENEVCSQDAITCGAIENCDYSNNFQWDEPAAFETHPAPKYNNYIGPTNSRSLLKVNFDTSLFVPTNPRSLLKTNYPVNIKPKRKFKQTLTVNSNLFEKRTIPSRKKKKSSESNSKSHKAKFKEKIVTTTMKSEQKPNSKAGILSATSSGSNNKKTGGKGKNKSSIHFGENITINHDNKEIICNKINLLPETIVKLEDYDLSDVEIDVEGEIDVASYEKPNVTIFNTDTLNSNIRHLQPKIRSSSEEEEISAPQQNKKITNTQKSNSSVKSICEMTEELTFQLRDMKVPKEELYLDISTVTDLEKYIHSEFFVGRITKTPEQYLRIRNHILTMWNTTGKSSYVSKTAVRNGLKHGGDVNCISRIHRLLEQIGAINFGFQGRFFEYVRPLDEYMSMFMQVNRKNLNTNIENSSSTNSSYSLPRMERRKRTQSNFCYSNGQQDAIEESNYTIHHLDGVFRPDVPALNSIEKLNIRNTRHIQTELDLVKCLKFSKDNLAPFKVSITLSTLLCIQFHSMSNVNERMGFLGGHRSKTVGRTKLSLTKYKPCRTSEQSGIMCEMCPISQVEQSTNLKSEGYELLGWFHSHPLFPPNPSRTDVRTQKEMQLQFSIQSDSPFVGVILSCLDMNFKCIYVMPKDLNSEFKDDTVCLPYELDVDIIKDCTNFNNDIKDVFRGIADNEDNLDMEEIIEKFKSSSDSILRQFGYKSSTFFNGVFCK